MLADEPGQRVLEEFQLVLIDQQVRALAAQLGGNDVQRGTHHLMPERGGCLERLQRAAMPGGGQLIEELAEPHVLRPDRGVGQFALRRRHAGRLAQIVARKNRLQRHGGLVAQMRGDLRVQRGDDFARRAGLVLKVGHVLQHLARRKRAGFQALDRAEFTEEPLLERRFLVLIDDWLGFSGAPGSARPS